MTQDIDRLQELLMTETPTPADAIVWLQGDQYDRGRRALELWQREFAPVIVLTGNNTLIGKGPRPGEENISLADMHSWLLSEHVPPTAIMIDDQSMHTRDQAVHVLSLAVREEWRRIILVGSPQHQVRAFLTFLHRADEIGWQGRLMNQPVHLDETAFPSGRDKTVAELLAEERAKLNEYHDHVATVADGLAYYTKL